MHLLKKITGDGPTSFVSLVTTKWDEIHMETGIFRYKINKLAERYVDGKYLLQLNPDRQTNRRTPEEMNNICQPFDEKKFNFNKVSPKEILFSIEGDDGDIHTVLVNVSPISRYHSLLCPSVEKCLPQVVTLKSLDLAVQIMFLAEDRDLRIGFNSMCGFASVNHLHYHLFVEKNTWYVETVEWQHLKGDIYCLDENYPVPAFCFEVQRHSSLRSIWNVLEYFLKKSIAHNILLTKRRLGGQEDAVNVILWPRRNTTGAKKLAAFNVAVLELSGWFPIFDYEEPSEDEWCNKGSVIISAIEKECLWSFLPILLHRDLATHWNSVPTHQTPEVYNNYADAFKNLQATDLEAELLKWVREDFNNICEEIKYL